MNPPINNLTLGYSQVIVEDDVVQERGININEMILHQIPLDVNLERFYKKQHKPNKGIKLGSYNSKSKNKVK